MTNEANGLELLFQNACEYKFNEFDKLLVDLEASRPIEEIWEAYLMRAQIKLYSTDETVSADLEKIDRFNMPARFPRLSSIWRVDSPNRFIVFSNAPGELLNFLQALPQVRQKFSRWYGEQGDITVRLIQGEIHYFLGETGKALELAEEQHHSGQKNNIDTILNQGLQFRCYLAMCFPLKAEECMLDMIRLSQSHPECQPVYHAIRLWANLTTNWNGDSPRFYDDPSGKRMPVLEDRLEGIRMGSARTTPLEEPFVKYAESGYGNAYALRHYYMDLFHAMYWFQAGDYQQTESYFTKLYHIAAESGIYMPLVECGEQITPLLQHVKDSSWGCSRKLIDKVISRAEQYEKSLKAYQDA